MHSLADGGPAVASQSLWMATADTPAFAPLQHDTHAQACIVGAGIAGLTTAYQLALDGVDVLVLDQGDLQAGQSARSTGHLCDALDDRYARLEALHGEQGARLAAHSHAAAVDAIERICRVEEIACGFARVDGFLVAGDDDASAADALAAERAAARRAGLQVDAVDAPPGVFAGLGPALRFPHQARFHVVEYLAGLARAVVRRGGRIHTGTRVAAIDGAGTGVVVAGGPRVRADSVVVATHVPFNDRLVVHAKQAAFRSYALALRIPPGSVPDVLLWDTLQPYHYVRTARTRNGHWLVVGGEDHRTGQDDSPALRYELLERWARRHVPLAQEVGYRWSGQVIEPVDALAFIGRNPGLADNVFVATGDSGNGLTHGTIAGLLLADLVVGRDSPWRALYAPNRKTLRAAEGYLKQTLEVASQYGDRVGGGGRDDGATLAAGEGALLRQGLNRLAAYRDAHGQLHLHSAVCPHLGCVVRWNAAEGSWDCPCHGSRFAAASGAVLDGPARRGLAPAPGAAPPRKPRPTHARPRR